VYYEVFQNLCKEHKVKPIDVSRATGISTATLTSWKKGVYTPKAEKLQLIADYFGVSMDYLVSGNTREVTALPDKAQELMGIVEKLPSQDIDAIISQARRLLAYHYAIIELAKKESEQENTEGEE
jgi:transcriptional regulator with XRE-family HTH domain